MVLKKLELLLVNKSNLGLFTWLNPNSSNSNWCCQSLVVRDLAYSNVVGNNYKGAFASRDRYRLYPLEYLIEKKTMPQIKAYSVRSAYERMTWRHCFNRQKK